MLFFRHDAITHYNTTVECKHNSSAETPKCVWLPFSRYAVYCSGLGRPWDSSEVCLYWLNARMQRPSQSKSRLEGMSILWNPQASRVKGTCCCAWRIQNLLNQRLSCTSQWLAYGSPSLQAHCLPPSGSGSLPPSQQKALEYKFRRGKKPWSRCQPTWGLLGSASSKPSTALSPEVSCTVQAPFLKSEFPNNGFWKNTVFIQKELGAPNVDIFLHTHNDIYTVSCGLSTAAQGAGSLVRTQCFWTINLTTDTGLKYLSPWATVRAEMGRK